MDPKKLDYFTFYEHPENDTSWALSMGIDKKVYIGLCMEFTSGGIAQLYNFDTEKEKLNHLADIAEITGDDPASGRATQGKIHFSLCPASDLKMYGSTHATTAPVGEPFWDPYSMLNDGYKYFEGAHLYYYDSKNYDVVDYGVIVPRQGVPLLTLSEGAERFFGVTYPLAHLFVCNMKGRGIIDLGKVSEHYPISMVNYKDKYIFTSDSYGQIIKVDAKKLKVDYTGVFLSHPNWSDGRLTGWMCDSVVGPDDSVYCCGYLNNRLMRFWPEGDEVRFEDLGYPLEEPIDANIIRILALSFDTNSNLFHILATDKGSYMMSYNIGQGIIKNHGLMKKDGLNATGWRSAIDEKGRVYFADVGNIPVNLWRYDPNK